MHPEEASVATGPGRRPARLVLALAVGLLGLWTVHAFLPALVWAGILAIATWPPYQRARHRLARRGHDILLPTLFTAGIALIFLVPLGILTVQFGHEAYTLLRSVHAALQTGLPVPGWVADLPFGQTQVAAWWLDNLGNPEGASDLLARLNRSEVIGFGRLFWAELSHRLVLFGFTLLTLFFLFRDGERLAAEALSVSRRAFGPHGERLVRQMALSVHGTVDGLVLVGLGEGLVLGIAYALAGVPHPTLLGALTALAAMVPFAAPVVFGAAALLLLLQGAVLGAAAVFGLGMAVLFVADHAIRPALIGGATRLPFLLVLIGILGGVEVWGLVGLFVGPALMAALTQLWRDWVQEATEDAQRGSAAGEAC